MVCYRKPRFVGNFFSLFWFSSFILYRGRLVCQCIVQLGIIGHNRCSHIKAYDVLIMTPQNKLQSWLTNRFCPISGPGHKLLGTCQATIVLNKPSSSPSLQLSVVRNTLLATTDNQNTEYQYNPTKVTATNHSPRIYSFITLNMSFVLWKFRKKN